MATVACTPGDPRSIENTRRDVRRILRADGLLDEVPASVPNPTSLGALRSRTPDFLVPEVLPKCLSLGSTSTVREHFLSGSTFDVLPITTVLMRKPFLFWEHFHDGGVFEMLPRLTC